MKKTILSLVTLFATSQAVAATSLTIGNMQSVKINDTTVTCVAVTSKPKCRVKKASGYIEVIVADDVVKYEGTLEDALATIGILRNAGLCD